MPDKLDGIVQCAGFTILKPFKNMSKDNMKNVMKVNFEAPALLTQQFLKQKKIEKAASIVFISSISGVFCSSVAGSVYSASKGAINGMLKSLAIELAPQAIRVNSVNPGMIDTNIFESSVITQEQLKEDMKKYPLKRYGKPEEVAYAVVYLLSDASKWVTGANLLIDGGYTCL
jgi:NAD(P)-dependent dehydrogenase (short-subunit alcohol dehydrogenase family)